MPRSSANWGTRLKRSTPYAPTAWSSSLETMTPEERLRELGLTLPPPPPPIGTYVGAVHTGNLLFLSGKGPDLPGGRQWRGKVGAELTIEDGYQAARDTMLNLLAVLREEIG